MLVATHRALPLGVVPAGGATLEMRSLVIDQHSRYRQRAVFLPRGLAGHAYWASVLPFHGVVFSGMARNIARGATQSREPAGSRTGP